MLCDSNPKTENKLASKILPKLKRGHPEHRMFPDSTEYGVRWWTLEDV